MVCKNGRSKFPSIKLQLTVIATQCVFCCPPRSPVSQDAAPATPNVKIAYHVILNYVSRSGHPFCFMSSLYWSV